MQGKGGVLRAARRGLGVAVIATMLSPTTAQATRVIRGLDNSWAPATVSIEAGGTVGWRSVRGSHDVVAYGRGWTFHRQLPLGSAVVSRRFRTPGIYRFRCTYHSTLIGNTCYGMCGILVVTR